MANLVDINQLYHFLSKSPVNVDTTLSKVRNKSGHTLTTDDIFGEEIPACFVPDDVDQLDNIPKSSLNKNDLAAIAYGSSNASYYYYDGSKWVNRGEWQDHELFFNKSSDYLNDGTHYKNAKKSDAVIEYHKDRVGYFVTDNNNNGTGSNKMSVRVLKNNNDEVVSSNFVSQFLQSTDKFVGGVPSLGYNPLVYNTAKKTILLEDANDLGSYISNSYAGVIQFNEKKETSGPVYVNDIKISVWEYVGKTLTEVLKRLGDSGFNYEVVKSESDRPVPSADLKGWIYFVPASKEEEEDNNIYIEYICVNKGTEKVPEWKWEQIGSTAITLPLAGDYLSFNEETNTYNVDVSKTVEDNANTVPTTKAVHDYVNQALPAAGDYLELENDNYNVKYSTSITSNSSTLPTTKAVYDYLEPHKEDENIHITSSERTAWNNKVNSITGDTYIKKSGTTSVSLSLNVADEYNDIIDEIDDENTANDTNRTTIPNSRAVWEFADISKYFFPYLKHDERKDYILYDISGNPMYISFVHKLTDGSNMFYGKQQFTTVHLDFPELINGENMFANCSSLENFGTETLNIEKLNNGANMFNNCSLNAVSVGFILEALKRTITTNTGCVMKLTVRANQKESVITLLNEQYNTNIPTDDLTQITSSTLSLTNKNGGTWNITIAYK